MEAEAECGKDYYIKPLPKSEVLICTRAYDVREHFARQTAAVGKNGKVLGRLQYELAIAQ